MGRQYGRQVDLRITLQLAGERVQGVALARYGSGRQGDLVRTVPGHPRVLWGCPVPGPYRQLDQLRAYGPGRLGTGAAYGFVVAMAVFAPGGEHHVVGCKCCWINSTSAGSRACTWLSEKPPRSQLSRCGDQPRRCSASADSWGAPRVNAGAASGPSRDDWRNHRSPRPAATRGPVPPSLATGHHSPVLHRLGGAR